MKDVYLMVNSVLFLCEENTVIELETKPLLNPCSAVVSDNYNPDSKNL